MNDNEQILKGLLDTLVLSVLRRGPNYGFGILVALREQLGEDGDILKESTLYPLLHRLERRELLTSFRQPGDRGTPRKYYQVTVPGEAYLQSRVYEWQRVALLLQRTILADNKELI
ncbi:PadR family transcriptional regulator [Marinimicrobium sp. ABcell2]|uniref:PadR family transcriptional regulator n=1 Tax=Marinimicrobium sp. ABcell2 TaxID=3069751 RepID=UPI0027AEEA83|nr:helix-turn-helix transcriptional regulator [Marinimicrobium sp. ABcell2]MDQ2076894.1 helix-turn-helix transcriptional regulator [Marinimicrobium sp. ABcell2]